MLTSGALTRYDAKGKVLRKGPVLGGLDFVCTSDGTRIFIDGNDSTRGKGVALDENFKKIGEFPNCENIRVTPDGSKLVIVSSKSKQATVRIVDTQSLKTLATYATKIVGSGSFFASNVSIVFEDATKALHFG
jgi:hypothetical protein